MGIVSIVVVDKVDMLCGGRHQFYREKFEDLLRKLSKVANLIFFEDGPLMVEKRDTFISRQDERYLRMIRVFNKIDNGVPLARLSSSPNLPRLSTFVEMMERAARKFGRLILAISVECDTELARYANDNPSVLAVLAEDSDFLIFAGKWQYWSVEHFNADTLETCEYSREALRTFLDVTDQQLTIVATLAGNDVLLHQKLHSFHKRNHIADFNKQKFPWLAKYVKENLSSVPAGQLVDVLARNALDTNNRETKYQIADSLQQYNMVSIIRSHAALDENFFF